MYKELLRCLRAHSKPWNCADSCICRDAVKRGYGSCSDELAKLAADAIEELQDRAKVLEKIADKWCEAVPKWIPVADGLPEEGKEVLCWIRNDAYGDTYATTGHYDTTFKMWDLDSENAMSRYVTHWMPLPEPPED